MTDSMRVTNQSKAAISLFPNEVVKMQDRIHQTQQEIKSDIIQKNTQIINNTITTVLE